MILKRIVVIDGSCFDVPDSEENARVFSRLGTIAAFPKVRLVLQAEITALRTEIQALVRRDLDP
ncbi:MAG: hypothetical protein V7L06_06705 [Nostoc sp.]